MFIGTQTGRNRAPMRACYVCTEGLRHANCLFSKLTEHASVVEGMALSKKDFLSQPDPSTGADYEATLSRVFPANSETLLMLAVLEEAIDSYKRFLFAKDRKAQKLFAEAESWILDRVDDALFSFENVCDVLGLSADYLRGGLLSWKEEQLAKQKEDNQGLQNSKSRRRKNYA